MISGKEIKVTDYEVYCGGAAWMSASNGNIPNGAIVVGNDSAGNPLFPARANFNNGMHPGKVSRSFHGALIPFGNQENLVAEYEVLVEK